MLSLTACLAMAEQQVDIESSGNTKPAVDGVAKLYRNPSERREAGVGTALTDWLSFSGLLELEKIYSRDGLGNSRNNSHSENPTQSIQAGFTVEAFDWLEAELIFLGENDRHYYSELEEGFIGIDRDNWSIKIGKQYLPFGEYYSYFVIGPMLEFGEVRNPSLIIEHALSDTIELTGFIFNGDADKNNSSNGRSDNDYDWGLAIDVLSEDESVRYGASYLSDLAETEEQLLAEEGGGYSNKVSGIAAYLLVGWGKFEVTAEMVRATEKFNDIEPDFDRPSAENIELAYFISQTLQLSLRVEHSRKLEDEPEWQYGFSVSWLLTKGLNFTVDIIHGQYKNGFAFDDDDNEFNYRNQVGALLSYEF